MAETAITTVLAKVAELVAWEAAVLLEVGDDVRLLRDKLEWLHTFIRDADRRRRLRDDEFVAVWVRQTRDVAFEAEDALDDFLHRAARRRRPATVSALAPGCSAWPRCAGQVALRHDLSGRIRQIRKRLDEISANRAAYNIEHTPSPAWAASSATTLAAWDDLEEYTVGFDKYSDLLKHQLLDDSISGRALVSIVGESSVGKTTLARKVYESPEVRNHFEIRTRTVLPPKSRPADVLRNIHRQASSQLRPSPSQGKVEDSCDISNLLFRTMTDRRYLVVIDGSIAVTDWNSLRASLPDEGNGSRVLLITDSAGLEVVGYAGPTYPPVELTRLNPENTYEVFRRRVFGRGDCPARFRSRYYQDIFRITRGLPLSIVVLAGVLRSKELPAEWDGVMVQLLAAREQSKNSNSRRILSLAFDDLPHHLKSCFLYFAAMRESTPVDAQRLVRLWVAEGFVRPRRGSTMEEVGQGYLKELISRCMVQLVKDEFGAVKEVVVHDRLHAFAQDEAQEASFIESHDSTDVLAPATVRRLAVQNSTDRYVHLSNALPKLRSIVCDLVEDRNGGGTKSSSCIQSTDLGFLHASKFLRVIDIHGLELKKLPNEIGSMIHISFIVTFSNRAPDPERDSAAVQEFLENMEGAFRAHTPWAGSSEEELESAGEGLEKYVMTKLFNRVFASVPEDVKSDEELFEKMSLLQKFIRPENLDIKPEYQNETSWLLAQKELQKINMYKAPRDKLACILNCCKVINNLLLNASIVSNENPPGADEFLPVLIYVTIKANPPQLHSNLLYIQRYRRQSRLVSEAQYFFTNILSAESFIWNIDAESLSMDELDFQKKMDWARERLLGLSAGSESQDNQANLYVREPRSQTLKTNGNSDVNLSLKDNVQGPDQDMRRDSDVSGKPVERVQSISDLEKKRATELLQDDDLNKKFQEYPFLFARAGDLTVADVENLLNSYKQLVLRYVALSQGMGVNPETPLVQSMQLASDILVSEEPEDVKNVVNNESSAGSNKTSDDIKNETLYSEVGNTSTQQTVDDPRYDHKTLKDEASDQPEHA